MHDIDFPIGTIHLNGKHHNGTHPGGDGAESGPARGRYQSLDVYDDAATGLMILYVDGQPAALPAALSWSGVWTCSSMLSATKP